MYVYIGGVAKRRGSFLKNVSSVTSRKRRYKYELNILKYIDRSTQHIIDAISQLSARGRSDPTENH